MKDYEKNILTELAMVTLQYVDLIKNSKPIEVNKIINADEGCLLYKNSQYRSAAHYQYTCPDFLIIEKLLSLFLMDHQIIGSDLHQQAVDGYRLRNQAEWHSIVSQTNYGISSYSGACNCNCVFCYEIPGLLPWENRILSIDETNTRCTFDYQDAYPGAIAQYKEPFTNKNLITILNILRSKASHTLTLSTNGSYLTPSVIKEIKKIKPILLQISLNSSNPSIRREFMDDRNPEIAIASLPILRDAEIQYTVSIVAWPDIGISDIIQTILYVDRFSPLEIVVHLPGISKYKQSKWNVRELDAFWNEVVQQLTQLRSTVSSPIKIFPSTYYQKSIKAIISGIHKGSPADKCDLYIGDEILEINGIPVINRSHSLALLNNTEDTYFSIRIKRGDEQKMVQLNSNVQCTYPFLPEGHTLPYLKTGIYLNEDFDHNCLYHIQHRIITSSYKKILIISSKLIYPLVQMTIKKMDFSFLCEEVSFAIVENHFFGGNICIGDLAVVDDYLRTVEKFLTDNEVPDAVFIPDSFLVANGLDILGKSFQEISKKFKVKVELIPCRKIFD